MPMTSGHGSRPALDRPRAFTAQRRAALPGVESVAGSDATMRVRMVESTEEHTLARDGAAVADIHGAACVEPGERDGAGPDDHPFCVGAIAGHWSEASPRRGRLRRPRRAPRLPAASRDEDPEHV